MNEIQKAQMEKSNKIIRGLDVQGIPVSAQKCQEFSAALSSQLYNRLKMRDCSSTSELKKLAEAEAGKFPTWPRTESTQKLSMSSEVVGRFQAPIAQEFCALQNIKRNISLLEGLAQKSFVGGGLVYPRHNICEDLGRIYVGEFNYTNLPKEFRPIVQVPEGFHIYVWDVRRAELFILAYMSGDEELLRDLNAEDYHQAVADRLGVDRPTAKVVSFSIVYGATPRFLATELSIEESEARKILVGFGKTYPRAWKFIRETYDRGVETGMSVTGYGTYREFPADPDRGKSAVSHALQSTAAEAVRLLIPDMVRLVEARGGKFLLTLFDNFVVQMPKSVTLEDAEKIRGELEESSKNWIFPLKFETASLGECWQ